MRKFLTGLLAVLMVVSVLAMLPVSAETTYVPDLIVTEVMANSTSGWTGASSGSLTADSDAFDYIEVYNRSENIIDLYSLSLYRAPRNKKSDIWETKKAFDAKIDLVKGNIWDRYKSELEGGLGLLGDQGDDYTVVNPTTAKLQPGQVAVIWFWTAETHHLCIQSGKNISEEKTAGGQYFKAFRDHYGIGDDVMVIAAYANIGETVGVGSKEDPTTKIKYAFDLANSGDYMYAIASNDAGFTTETAAVNASGEVDSKIYSLFAWGAKTKTGADKAAEPTSDSPTGYSEIYVPSTSTADFFMKQQEVAGKTFEEKCNYLHKDVKIATYKEEAAMFAFAQKPTPGTMPVIQWAYVDPARYELDNSPATGWKEAALNAFVTANIVIEDDVENGNETEKEIEFLTREEIEALQKKSNVKKYKEVKKLYWWAWIIIGVGAAGAAAAVVIVILKVKKKKQLAAQQEVVSGDVSTGEDAAANTVEEDKSKEDKSEEDKSKEDKSDQA